jgi:hypothetical protein
MVAAITGAISLGVAAYQAYKQHKAANEVKAAGELQKEAAYAGAQLLDWNASVARMQAADALARGAEDERRFRENIDVMVGAQRAGFAAQNVDVGFGSAVDTQADAAYLGELDALQIRNNAAREAWGFNVQATDYNIRAMIQRKEGVNMVAAANVNAASMNSQAIIGLASTGASLLMARYGMQPRQPKPKAAA